jgi:hypothetical protein
MPSPPLDFYEEAHLFVAAVRLHTHQHGTPPVLEDVCRMLAFSAEKAGFIARRLAQSRVVEIVQGSFGDRFFVADHRRLEEIPRGELGSKLEEELKKFQDSQKGIAKRFESLAAEQADRQKSRFAEMEKKLKEELEKKSRPPA